MRQLNPRSFVTILELMSLSVALVGCTYVDTQLQRRAPPDTRVKLGWQDRLSVYSRRRRFHMPEPLRAHVRPRRGDHVVVHVRAAI